MFSSWLDDDSSGKTFRDAVDSLKTDEIIGFVARLHSDGKIDLARAVEKYEEKTFEAACKVFEVRKPKKGGKLNLLLIPEKNCKTYPKPTTTRSWVSKATCQYEAISRYMRNMFGMELDSDDRDWYVGNPLVEAMGAPMPLTLRIAQELIEPYGLRISRVRCTPGLRVSGNLVQWMDVLGVNPLALGDFETTNAQFAAQTGQPVEAIDALYRMEFNEEPLRPCVTCGTTAVGNGLGQQGHASYISLRSKTGRAQIQCVQFQIARKQDALWRVPPVFDSPTPEPEAEQEPEETERISLYMTELPDGQELGKSLYQQPRSEYKSGQLQLGAGDKKSTFSDEDPKLHSYRPLIVVSECFVCGRRAQALHMHHVCESCWQAMWSCYGFMCPHAEHATHRDHKGDVDQESRSFSVHPPTMTRLYKGPSNLWHFEAECVVCRLQCGFEITLERTFARIIKDAAFGRRPDAFDQRIIGETAFGTQVQ